MTEVIFLGTTPTGATVQAGPFDRVNVTASEITGVKVKADDTEEPVTLATRNRDRFMFEGELSLLDFDIRGLNVVEAVPAAPAPVPEEQPKPKRKYKRRKKAAEAEATTPAPETEANTVETSD